MIKGLAHVCLATKDLAAAEKFYCQGLGLSKAFDFIRDDKVVGFYLELSQCGYIEVFERDQIDPDAKGPIQHFCIEVDDLDEIARRLSDSGYKTTEKKVGADQSWQMWTSDPSGVRIEFHQYTENSSQATRKDCILK